MRAQWANPLGHVATVQTHCAQSTEIGPFSVNSSALWRKPRAGSYRVRIGSHEIETHTAHHQSLTHDARTPLRRKVTHQLASTYGP